MWDLPGPGIKPVSPAFQGGFLTLDHQGNLQILFLFVRLFKQFFWCEPLLKSLLNSLGLPRWCSGEKSHLPMQETQETWVWSLGWKDPLELEMATCSRICAWKIPGGAWWATVHEVAKSWTRLTDRAYWFCYDIASVVYVLFCLAMRHVVS